MTGIRAWNPPNQRPTTAMFFILSFSMESPLQMETANASMDRPTASVNNVNKSIVFSCSYVLCCAFHCIAHYTIRSRFCKNVFIMFFSREKAFFSIYQYGFSAYNGENGEIL